MVLEDDYVEAPGGDGSLLSDRPEATSLLSVISLRPLGAKGSTFAVELSNGERLRLRSETVATHGLNVGAAVDAEAVLDWQRDDNNRRGLEAGLNYVSYRLRSTKEVNDHLRKKSFDAAACSHAVKRLKELGYLDDAEFARFWVESRDTHRPRGKRALAWELRRKGIADSVIEDVLARFAGDERTLARTAARKRAATLASNDPMEFRSKLGAFLARRGFGYDVAEQVVNELWEELRDVDSPGSTRVDM